MIALAGDSYLNREEHEGHEDKIRRILIGLDSANFVFFEAFVVSFTYEVLGLIGTPTAKVRRDLRVWT